ncbi:hypothetical protein D9M71_508750 [compost metagenome]
MADAARLGAGDHEAPVGLVGQRGPHLLPADPPLAAGFVQHGAGLHRRQVGAGARLRVALAPEFATGDDARQEAALLFIVAECGDGRPGQSFANMAHASRSAGARVFLVEDHLLADRQAAPAILRRPADTGPAALGELALPGLAFLREAVLVARTATEAQRFEFATQVVRQPGGDLGAEGFVFGAETDPHDSSPSRCAAMRSRCSDGAPRKASLARARLK